MIMNGAMDECNWRSFTYHCTTKSAISPLACIDFGLHLKHSIGA